MVQVVQQRGGLPGLACVDIGNCEHLVTTQAQRTPGATQTHGASIGPQVPQPGLRDAGQMLVAAVQASVEAA